MSPAGAAERTGAAGTGRRAGSKEKGRRIASMAGPRPRPFFDSLNFITLQALLQGSRMYLACESHASRVRVAWESHATPMWPRVATRGHTFPHVATCSLRAFWCSFLPIYSLRPKVKQRDGPFRLQHQLKRKGPSLPFHPRPSPPQKMNRARRSRQALCSQLRVLSPLPLLVRIRLPFLRHPAVPPRAEVSLPRVVAFRPVRAVLAPGSPFLRALPARVKSPSGHFLPLLSRMYHPGTSSSTRSGFTIRSISSPFRFTFRR